MTITENSKNNTSSERKIDQLGESMRSLLMNMPAMTFSKDVETGQYLACNQEFAEYADKETPAEVAGLTDFEIFDKATAEHFTADDRKALEMNEPYILYEDVVDAVGNPRQFQTTKLKVHDTKGRLCLLGMSVDVTEMMRIKKEIDQAKEEKRLYGRLNALNGNLLVLYMVDPETNQYKEYSATSDYKELGFENQGNDFFATSLKNSLRAVYSKDQDLFHTMFTKQKMLEEIKEDGVFILDYRLLVDDLPICVRLKAAMVEEDGKKHLIVGLLDVDAQVRREQEYARKLSVARDQASKDALTGVKNKHAYVEVENQLNEQIDGQEKPAFAIVVCDINDLKTVNDTKGHKEGDHHIRKACADICKIFSHSPVYRVGGDEFAVICQGEDYEHIDELLEELHAGNIRNRENGGVKIAFGMARFEDDHSVEAVFERADRLMYEHKVLMKS